jgi:hypothetical protein
MSIMKYEVTLRRIIFFPVLLMILISLSSCGVIIAQQIMAMPDKLPGTKKAANYQGAESRNILIIGLIADSSQQVGVENAFIDRFTKPGLHPIAGSKYFQILLH